MGGLLFDIFINQECVISKKKNICRSEYSGDSESKVVGESQFLADVIIKQALSLSIAQQHINTHQDQLTRCYFSLSLSLSLSLTIYIYIYIVYSGSKSLSYQGWLNTAGFFIFLNLQEKTFVSSHKSFYFWVKLLKKEPDIATPTIDTTYCNKRSNTTSEDDQRNERKRLG